MARENLLPGPDFRYAADLPAVTLVLLHILFQGDDHSSEGLVPLAVGGHILVILKGGMNNPSPSPIWRACPTL